ncbi:MAG: TonB-dependent receptor plug domain-containing protein, partial [Bacteroidota bacterium]
VRLGSVNGEKTFHGELNAGGKKIASLTTFNVSDFGDLKMGARKNPALGEAFGLRNQVVTRAADNQSDQLTTNSDPLIQRESGYRQTDFMQKILVKPSDRVSHLVALQYSNSTDIPRYDRLTDPGAGNAGLKFAQWYYGPQKRMLSYYRIQVNDLGKWADRMTATVSNQWIEESRHQRRFNSTNLQHRIEDVGVTALTIDLQKKSGKDDIRYGIDTQFNRLKSTANAENIVTGAVAALDTRYPNGNNTMNFIAAYLTHTRRLSDNLTVNDGLRTGTSQLHARFKDKTFFPFPFDEVNQNNFTGSASAGLVYTPGNWKISVLAGTGFRAPNVDDLAKVFESVAGNATTTGTLIVPNPDLKPEKTVNVDLGITRFIGTTTRIEGTLFATNMTDAIVTKGFTLDGQSTVTYNGFAANVFANQNASRAVITGAILQLRSDFSERWNFTAAWNQTRGRVINKDGADTPLDHIAPNFGRAGVQYTGSRVRAELFSNFSGWKRLADYSPSGEDNLQYATAKGMPSWWTLNLRWWMEVSKSFTLQTGIDNMFDLQYRTFASGINAPGRNFFITGRLKF